MCVTVDDPRLLFRGLELFDVGLGHVERGRWIERLHRWRWLAGRPRSGQEARVQATMPRAGLAADQRPESGGRVSTALGQVSQQESVSGGESGGDAQEGGAGLGRPAAADDQTIIFPALTGDSADGQAEAQQESGAESGGAAVDQTVIFPALTGDSADDEEDARQESGARSDDQAEPQESGAELGGAAADQTVIFRALTWGFGR